MKKSIAVAFVFLGVAIAAHAQNLDAVLNSMDKAAASFKTVETDFVWDQFSKVVSDHDLQEGTMYFRRNGNNVEMAANVNKPDRSRSCLRTESSRFTSRRSNK